MRPLRPRGFDFEGAGTEGALLERVRGVHRAAVLRPAHHVTQREEHAAQQHHAEKQSDQMPALQNPFTAAASSASSHSLTYCSRASSPTAK